MRELLGVLSAFLDEHQHCGELDGGRDNDTSGSRVRAGRRSSTRLARLPQHRHERNAARRRRRAFDERQ